MTTWRPDTCRCVINYDYNQTTKTIFGFEFVKQCDLHLLLTPQEVMDENKKKNKVVGEIVEKLVVGEPKAEDFEKIVWSFDKNRNVVIDDSSFSASDKLKIQEVVNKYKK